MATLVALVAAGLAVQALPGAGFDRQPRIRAYRAKADAFVSEANRRTTFGRARVLRVDAAPAIHTYIRFNVDLHSVEVRHVSLLLWSRTRLRRGYQVRLAEGPWSERGITFANAPMLSPEFIASGRVRARAWKAVDVTSLITGGEQSLSLVLNTTSVNGAEFASRESGFHGPRLVVETVPPETTASTSTSSEGN